MDIKREALELHRKNRGKIQLCGKVRIKDSNDLSLVYTPGVAEPCKEIRKDDSLVYQYTNKGNMVAIVTDGSSVLGLGNIGSKASMPVMEGKALLFKELANIDAFPICLESQDKEDIIFTVKQISPTFGGINLEDISAPKCFEIEKRLKKELDIPVFHDDQHGTAIVVLAAIINSLKIAKKNLQDVKIVINGSGAAGIGICNLLLVAGARDIIVCDSKGILNPMDSSLASYKKEIARKTNPRGVKGRLRDAIKGVDIFIGVSTSNVLDREDVERMNEKSIILALANPIPEMWPDEAKGGGALIIGTGRSDFPNQVNNVLAFPGVLKGALDVRSREINEEMMLEAAFTLANQVPDSQLKVEKILPSIFNKDLVDKIAISVAKKAIDMGVSRI